MMEDPCAALRDPCQARAHEPRASQQARLGAGFRGAIARYQEQLEAGAAAAGQRIIGPTGEFMLGRGNGS